MPIDDFKSKVNLHWVQEFHGNPKDVPVLKTNPAFGCSQQDSRGWPLEAAGDPRAKPTWTKHRWVELGSLYWMIIGWWMCECYMVENMFSGSWSLTIWTWDIVDIHAYEQPYVTWYNQFIYINLQRSMCRGKTPGNASKKLHVLFALTFGISSLMRLPSGNWT